MGVEDTTKTDTRTETTDRPASQERPYTPPPDNPGSPGQPSRLESLARAREQQQSRAQETQDKDAGSSPRGERDDKATTEQPGSGNEKAETSGKPEAEDQDRREDDDRPGTDQRGRQDKREEEPRSQDEGTPGDRDRPQAQTAEQHADTRAEPADRPASSERRWAPPPDNPGSPGQPSRLESLARAREEQERRSQQSEGTDTGTRTTEQRDDQPATAQPQNDGADAEPAGKFESTAQEQDAGSPGTDEGRTEDGPKSDAPEASPTPEQGARGADKPTEDGREPHPEPAGQTTDQPTGPQEPRPATTTGELGPQERATDPPRTAEQGPQTSDGPADDGIQPRPEPAEQPTAPDTGTGTHADEPGDQPTTDNAPSLMEETDQDPRTHEPHGEQDRDRDKKSEDTDNGPSPDETNETDREGKTNPILLDVRSDSRGKVNFEPRYQRDDASGTEPEERNTVGWEGPPARRDLGPVDPDRIHNDTGDPLETPEEQDLNESGRDRWENAEAARTTFNSARTVIDKARKLVAPEKPTGHPESRPPNAIDNLQQHPTSSDLMSSIFTLAAVGGFAIKRLNQVYSKRRMGDRS